MTGILDVSPKHSNTTLTEAKDYQSVSGRTLCLAVGGDGRLYAGTYSGVWRSDDGGKTFTQSTRPQRATFEVARALGGYEVYDVAVSPVDPDVVLAVTRYDLRSVPRQGIYRSTDGGNRWVLVHQFPQFPTRAGQLVWTNRDAVYAAWGSSIAISRDGGASFIDSIPWGSESGAAYHVVGEDGKRVYALGNSRMWVSLDGGSSWQLDLGLVPAPSGQATGDAQSNAPRVLAAAQGSLHGLLLITDPGTDRSYGLATTTHSTPPGSHPGMPFRSRTLIRIVATTSLARRRRTYCFSARNRGSMSRMASRELAATGTCSTRIEASTLAASLTRPLCLGGRHPVTTTLFPIPADEPFT